MHTLCITTRVTVTRLTTDNISAQNKVFRGAVRSNALHSQGGARAKRPWNFEKCRAQRAAVQGKALARQAAGGRRMTTWRLESLPCGAWSTAWSVQPSTVEVRCVGSWSGGKESMSEVRAPVEASYSTSACGGGGGEGMVGKSWGSRGGRGGDGWGDGEVKKWGEGRVG